MKSLRSDAKPSAELIAVAGWEVLLNSDDGRYGGRGGGPGNSSVLWRWGDEGEELMAILATRDFMGNSLGFNGGNEDLMGFNGV